MHNGLRKVSALLAQYRTQKNFDCSNRFHNELSKWSNVPATKGEMARIAISPCLPAPRRKF